MNNKCIYHRTRSHKRQYYGYCTKYRKEVPLFCKCDEIEYKEKSSLQKKSVDHHKALQNRKRQKHKLTKKTDISDKVKKEVWERDNHCCVVCGNNYNVMPNAHIVSRAHGGLGIETNIVTLCTNLTPNKCHEKYDNGTKEEKERIDNIITAYMKSIYGNSWNKEDQKYKK